MREVIITAAVIGLVFLAIRPRPLFVLHIADGRLRVRRGKVAAFLLDAAAEIVRRNGLAQGTIYGIVCRGRTRLAFSRHIPPGCRQQFRNLWINGA